MNNHDLDAILDAHIHVERVGTHWPGCHLSHRPCAIAALVAEVRVLRGRVATLEDERERYYEALHHIAVHDENPTIVPDRADLVPPGWATGMIQTAKRALGRR